MNVYCLYFPNGKRYVGIESNSGQRIRYHMSGYTQKGKSIQMVTRAILKYGGESIAWRYLFKNCDVLFGKKMERFFIKLFDTQNPSCGYNYLPGGECERLGIKLTEEHKKKIGLSQKGKIVPGVVRDRIRSSMIGKMHTEERRAAIAAGRLKRMQSGGWAVHNKNTASFWRANSGSFKAGGVAPLRGRIMLPGGPNGSPRYFKPEQICYA